MYYISIMYMYKILVISSQRLFLILILCVKCKFDNIVFETFIILMKYIFGNRPLNDYL